MLRLLIGFSRLPITSVIKMSTLHFKLFLLTIHKGQGKQLLLLHAPVDISQNFAPFRGGCWSNSLSSNAWYILPSSSPSPRSNSMISGRTFKPHPLEIQLIKTMPSGWNSPLALLTCLPTNDMWVGLESVMGSFINFFHI